MIDSVERDDCLARFELPVEIARGEGTLAMAIEDERFTPGMNGAMLGIGSGINCLMLGVGW